MTRPTTTRLTPLQEQRLVAFGRLLVDQERARVIVAPHRHLPGHWFGGGNLTLGTDGRLFLVGRYRNQGDSRLGLAAGERGLELAVFSSADRGETFQPLLRLSKRDLSQPGREVVSIEGCALLWTDAGVELYVSSEKDGVGYPPSWESYLKDGCGVWSIERLTAPTVGQLAEAQPETVFASRDLEHLHWKDPKVYREPGGNLLAMFCSHPYCWSSSNTVFAERRAGHWSDPQFHRFSRGTTWDVAMSRGTCLLALPRQGAFQDRQVTLLFYDGGECVRDLAEHSAAVCRPRGYSCEELGGLAYCLEGDREQFFRLSAHLPLFVSPHGTGCSRYVDVLSVPHGYYVTWQQSQPDRSQPLVMNFVDRTRADECLSDISG